VFESIRFPDILLICVHLRLSVVPSVPTKKAPGPRPEAFDGSLYQFSSERGFSGRIKIPVKPKPKTSGVALSHRKIKPTTGPENVKYSPIRVKESAGSIRGEKTRIFFAARRAAVTISFRRGISFYAGRVGHGNGG
jgi:hypothetical protein